MPTTPQGKKFLNETATAAKIAIIPMIISTVVALALSVLLGTFVANFAILTTSLTTGTVVQLQLYSNSTNQGNEPYEARITIKTAGGSILQLERAYYNTAYTAVFRINLDQNLSPGVYQAVVKEYMDDDGYDYVDQTVYFRVLSGQIFKAVPIAMSQDNLVANAGFESGWERGWYGLIGDQASGYGSLSSYYAYSTPGYLSLKVNGEEGDVISGGLYKRYQVGYGADKLRPLTNYTVSSWLKPGRSEQFDQLSTQVKIDSQTLKGNSITNANQYQPSSLAFKTPMQGFVDVYFGYASIQEKEIRKGEFYLDDVTLKKGGSPASPEPPDEGEAGGVNDQGECQEIPEKFQPPKDCAWWQDQVLPAFNENTGEIYNRHWLLRYIASEGKQSCFAFGSDDGTSAGWGNLVGGIEGCNCKTVSGEITISEGDDYTMLYSEDTVLKDKSKPSCCQRLNDDTKAFISASPYNADQEYCCYAGTKKARPRPKCVDVQGNFLHQPQSFCTPSNWPGGWPANLKVWATSDGCCLIPPDGIISPEIKDFIDNLPEECSATITAAETGCHSLDSTHYEGCGIDLQNTTGCDLNVTGSYTPGECIKEGTHYHCQLCDYRPNNPRPIPTPTPTPR